MPLSSEQISRQAATLPRQDTTVTVSSLSTSYTNLETGDSIHSNSSSTKYNHDHKINNNHKRKNDRKKARRHSNEHFHNLISCDAKTLRALKVHYYPEEQYWSYVIVFIAFVVQVIDHGLQTSYGMILVNVLIVFGNGNGKIFPFTGEFKLKSFVGWFS